MTRMGREGPPLPFRCTEGLKILPGMRFLLRQMLRQRGEGRSQPHYAGGATGRCVTQTKSSERKFLLVSGLEATVDSVSPGELIKTDCWLASGSVALALPC